MAVKREKVVQTAEKYVQRGKIDAAIREYRKVLAEQPDDATTLNRVGDLYARSERIDEAIKLFTQIAQNYTADGFFPKATAIYKKIIKLDPTRLGVYEQLAGLYHRQGLLNEARTQYQVLADYYLKHDNATSATAIYERMTEVDPDDPSLRVRLAELYQGQKLLDKAMAQYRRIAEMMLDHGHPDEAEQVLLKALQVDASDLGFITDGVLKLKESGHVASAARFLTAAVERNPEAARVAGMVDVPAQSDAPLSEAGTAPGLVASTAPPQAPPPQAPPPQAEPAPPSAAAPAGEPPAAAAEADLVLDVDEAPELDLAETDVPETATPAMAALETTAPDTAAPEPRAEAATFTADDLTHSGEITLDLDSVFDLEGEDVPESQVLPPADLLEDDAEVAAEVAPAGAGLEPEPVAEPDEMAEPDPIPADGAIDADFLERTAAELHPERIQQEEDLVTEAEVLAKYGLTEKAMERLGELLVLNPQHPGGLGLLVRLHLDEGKYEGAAELASELARLAPRSEAWSQTWDKLERSGFLRTDSGVVVPPGVEPEEADTTPGLEVVEEAREALETTATTEPAFSPMELLPPPVEPAEPAAELDEPEAAAPAQVPEPPAAEPPAAEPPGAEAPAARSPAEAPPASGAPQAAPPRRRRADVDGLLASLVEDLMPRRRKRAAEDGGAATPPAAAAASPSAPGSEAPATPPAESVAPPPSEPSPEWLENTVSGEAPAASAFSDEEDFFDLAAELEEELSREGALEEDEDLLIEQPREQSLEEIVEGFKKGVSENLSQEDHHTHFDLGIAYREMGLLDEAIGEFQVAAKSPVLLVECCSMLGLCFLEKGLPELAVKWYRRGLAVPELGEDDQLGLLYDLGNAHMAAGERDEAHRTFLDIYGTNSNYRDVVAKVEETRAR